MLWLISRWLLLLFVDIRSVSSWWFEKKKIQFISFSPTFSFYFSFVFVASLSVSDFLDTWVWSFLKAVLVFKIMLGSIHAKTCAAAKAEGPCCVFTLVGLRRSQSKACFLGELWSLDGVESVDLTHNILSIHFLSQLNPHSRSWVCWSLSQLS